MNESSKYWDINHTLTYNYLINIIVGNRGGGKTYGFKRFAIDNFIKKKEQFGYIRRFKEDLKKSLPTFFNDIKKEYPDYEFKVEGEKFYIRLKTSDPKTKWTDNDIERYFLIATICSYK